MSNESTTSSATTSASASASASTHLPNDPLPPIRHPQQPTHNHQDHHHQHHHQHHQPSSPTRKPNIANPITPHVHAPRLLAAFLPSRSAAVASAGIILSLLVYALLQERIMTSPYVPPGTPTLDLAGQPQGEYFKNSLLLVLANRLAAAASACLVILYKKDYRDLKNAAPIYTYVLISFSNVIASGCQYEALKWVTLPTQTLAKSAKMIPVLILGATLFGKKYKPVDYAAACAVALGCTAFMLSGNIAPKRVASADSYYGLLLMAAYLLFDGFTSTFQERLFSGYQMSIYNAMLYVNLSSAAMSFVLLALSGKLQSSADFIIKYPQILTDMSILSVSAVTGQFAITYTIKMFGALLYATVMTIRQFLTVFLSNIIFRHGMNIMQWLSAAVVFLALFYRSWTKQNKSDSRPKEEAESETPDAIEKEPLRPSS